MIEGERLSVEYDGIGRGRDGSGDDVDTNAPGRVRGSGDPGGEQEATGGVERDWRHRNDVEGIGCDGNSGRMDDATSAARRDSKRVETDALAKYEASQHEQRQRTTTDAPEPSNPPPQHHEHPWHQFWEIPTTFREASLARHK